MVEIQGYTLKQHIACFVGSLIFACACFYLDALNHGDSHFSQDSKFKTELHAKAMNLPPIR